MNSPMIGHDGPRTVTFGADPKTEAQHRSARLGSRVVGATLGVAAAVLTAVALVFNFNMAADIARTWRELAVLGSIAFALTLALTGLPVASAVMRRSYPAEAMRAMAYWGTALAITTIGGLLFVFSAPAAHVLTAAEAAEIEELRQAIRTLSQPQMAVWRRSTDCSAPQSSADRATCDAIRARDAGYRAQIADIEAGPAPGAVRRLFVLILSLAAVAGAGLLGRLGVLASAESYRLAEGAALPDTTLAGHPMTSSVPALTTPLDTAELWFQGRVMPDANGRLSPPHAYEDYARVCQDNGLPPMTQGAFFNLLAAKAKASAGNITRVKTGGRHVYAGWALAMADMGGLPGNADELIAIPYRS